MKKCSKCKEEKGYEGFYKDKKAGDGYNGICKLCRLEMDRARRVSDLDWVERRKKQNADFHKENKECIAIRKKEWFSSEDGKKRHVESSRKYRERYPEKNKAHDAVYRAIKRGELMRPDHCQKCNVQCRSEAHHSSYDKGKRTSILWLCKSCHEIITRNLKGI